MRGLPNITEIRDIVDREVVPGIKAYPARTRHVPGIKAYPAHAGYGVSSHMVLYMTLAMGLIAGLIILSSPTAHAQRTSFALKDAPTGVTITFDSIRVVRTRDGATWVSKSSSIDLTVGVEEESTIPATVSVMDGRVEVTTDGTPIRTMLLDLEGRVVEGMQPAPAPYILRMEGAFGSYHVLINTAVNSVRRLGPSTNPKAAAIASTEEYMVTVYRGIFTSSQIRVNVDPSAGSRVNVVVPRPSWTNRVVGVRISIPSWSVDTPLFRGKAQAPADFSNLWSISKDADSYELSTSGGFTGTASYTVGNVNGATWEGAYVEQSFRTKAVTFDVTGVPIFTGNEVRFTPDNTENMRYYERDAMGGNENEVPVTEGMFVFVLE
jgi:hypothetical protein